MGTELFLRCAAAEAGRQPDRGCNWINVDPFHPELLPRAPGCYAVYLDGALVYIGQTQNLRRRLRRYGVSVEYFRDRGLVVHTPWASGRSVAVKVRRSRRFGDWLMAEARLVRRLRPLFNTKVPRIPHAASWEGP